jgi:hypothetical protein
LIEHITEEPLTTKLSQLVMIWDVVEVERYVTEPLGSWLGRPMHNRRSLARAFVAKAVYNLPTTECLIDLLKCNRALRRLCGYECVRQVPSASTFSRAFAEFAAMDLGDRVLGALVNTHVGEQIVAHVSRDSTAVVARERVIKQKTAAPVKKKRGRPKKGEVRPGPELTRLQKQLKQNYRQSLSELAKACDWGAKKDTGGHMHCWKGYKAHIDYADGAIPLQVVTTSASVHDSQVAIPMARRTAERVTSLYDLMDSAYDTPQIRQVSQELGHVAIIDPHPRRNGVATEKLFDPATKERYKQRTAAERGNSRLKDEFGLRHLRVRGNAKAHMHIMFGILALFADQIMKPIRG